MKIFIWFLSFNVSQNYLLHETVIHTIAHSSVDRYFIVDAKL